MNLVLPNTQIAKWVGLYLQLDESGDQWYFQRFVATTPVVGAIFDTFDVLNTFSVSGQRKSFKKGEINFTVEILAGAEVTSYISEASYFLPNKYKVGMWLDEQTPKYYILKSDFGSGERYSPNGNLNVGLVGSVWDEKEMRRLGSCMMEHHQLQTLKESIAATVKMAGLESPIF